MALYKASMCLAINDGYVLNGSTSNDFLVYTGNSNQNMLFGTSNATPIMTINGSNGNVAFKGNVSFNNQMNMSGVVITQTTAANVQNISSQIYAINGFLNTPSGVNITIPGPNGNNAITFGNSNGTEFMRLNQNGFLGIGTSLPAYTLDVNGSANVSSNLTLVNPACAISNAGSLQVGGTLKVVTGANISGGASVAGGLGVSGSLGLSNSTGNANIYSSNTFVGIGTSLPAYTLDVNGNANISSNMSINGNVMLNSNLIVMGKLTACNVSYVTSNIIVFSSEVINSNLNVYQMTTMCNVNVLSNMNLTTTGCAFSNAGNLQVGGNVSISGTLNIASSALVTNLNAQYLNGNASSFYTNLANITSGTLSTNCVVPASCVSTGTFAPIANPSFTGATSNAGNLQVTGNTLIGNSMTFTNTGGNLSLYTSSQNFGINQTNPSYTLHVGGTIYATGDITALSDGRFKTDRMPLVASLEKICQMRAYTYTRLDENNNKRHIGLIAQEVNEIIPELIDYDAPNDMYGIKYGNAVGLLVEAIKELSIENKELGNRIRILEEKV